MATKEKEESRRSRKGKRKIRTTLKSFILLLLVGVPAEGAELGRVGCSEELGRGGVEGGVNLSLGTRLCKDGKKKKNEKKKKEIREAFSIPRLFVV
jgi:hypothetical protein